MQMGYDFETGRPATPANAEWRARLGLGADALSAPARGLQPGIGIALDSGEGESVEPAVLRQPEWASLKARFQAMYALRQALVPAAGSQSAAAQIAGGFANAGPSVLSSCRNGALVNPVYWGNSKAPCGMTGSFAAAPKRSDRGPA